MAKRTFQSVVQRLVPHVPGCPFPVIEQFIRDVAIDACERTLSWRYVQPPIRLTPGVYDYPYELPTGSDIHAFLTVAVNGKEIAPLTIEETVSLYPGFVDYDTDKRSEPRHIFQINPRMFGVLPIPDDSEDYDLNMVVALKPLRDSDGMDKIALDELENTIMHGALQHLLVIPDKNWTNDKLAAYHAGQYRTRLTERRARANLGAGRASLSVQMRPFA